MTQDKNSSASPRFQIGDRVRVQYGVVDADYPDIPLGGWSGTVVKTKQVGDKFNDEVEWDEKTLDGMHRVFTSRCERDGFKPEAMWLGEEDLDADDGTPVPIEQPTAIKTPALSEQDQEDRVRAALGLTHDDPLPRVRDETLLTYSRYLAATLKFPFVAIQEAVEFGPFASEKRTLTVTGLLDPEGHVLEEDLGVIGLGIVWNREEAIEFSLDEIKVEKENPNAKLLSDYTFWYQNLR